MKKVLVFLMFVLISLPVFAADLKTQIYGQLYVDAFYHMDSKDMHLATDGRYSDHNYFDVNVLDMSRLGVNLEFGKFSGTVEAGLSDGNYLRLFFVSYDFGNAGKFTLGQDWTIAGWSYGQVSMDGNEMCDYGAVNNYRRPQLRYSISGFDIALVHSGSDNGMADSAIFTGATDIETNQYFPRIELAYNIENDYVVGSIFGSYGYYSVKDFSSAATGDYVTYAASSFHVGIGGTVTLGDAFINLTAYYGQNMYLSSALTGGIVGSASGLVPLIENGKVQNVQSVGGGIGVGYTVGIVTPQVGLGYNYAMSDSYTDGNPASMAAFINAAIQFNEWLSLTPEIVYIDQGKDGYGTKLGNRIIAGVQFLAAF